MTKHNKSYEEQSAIATLEKRIQVLKARYEGAVQRGWHTTAAAMRGAITDLESVLRLLEGEKPDWTSY